MTEGSLEKVVAFSAIWSVTVFILISAAGTIIMRQVCTSPLVDSH
jgi:hypothetical protein